MTVDQIKRSFEVLPLRERLIFKLAVLVGLRPGEIFALRRGTASPSGSARTVVTSRRSRRSKSVYDNTDCAGASRFFQYMYLMFSFG
jgi:hypothetical protein